MGSPTKWPGPCFLSPALVSDAVHGSASPRLVLILAGVAFALLGSLACGRGHDGVRTRTGTLMTVDGSSTVFPISEAVAEEFQRDHRDVRITVGISGTGGGFKKFCRGETDLTGASRPIARIEIDECARVGITFTEIPIAYDGLTVVVHPQNTWVDFLRVSELKRLWEPAAQRTITRWNQVRPGWPNQEIRLFGAGADSGTFDYFTEAIVGKEKASRGDFTASEDDNVLVQGVANDEYALGFFGYAYYEENQQRLRAVPIDPENGVPPVAPSPETVRDGSYQPLSRPIFLYANQQSLERPELRQLIDFYLGEGIDLVREVGYVPLSDREYTLVRQRVADGVSGTMFGPEDSHSRVRLEALLTRGR